MAESVMAYATRGVNKVRKAALKDDKKRAAPSKPRKPRKSRSSAKARTLCMWHAPEQICRDCNGGKLKLERHDFPELAEGDTRVPVRLCRHCCRPLTRDQYTAAAAIGCHHCGTALP